MQVDFNNLLEELTVNEMRSDRRMFHTSNAEIGEIRPSPMWFAVEEDHARDGWYKNAVDDDIPARMYQVSFEGNLADVDDFDVKKLFEKSDIDLSDYVADMTSNPSMEEIIEHEGTKLLLENSYDAIEHMDYDPRNFDKDLPSVLVFDPKQHTTRWKDITPDV